MATLVVKNLPEQLHDRLRRRAERNHRSVTKEVISLIEAAVAEAEAGGHPARQDAPELSIDEIKAAIADGRFAHYRSLDEINEWVDELRQDRDVAP